MLLPRYEDDYRRRMARATGWILEQLAARDIRATFFIVGQIAEDDPGLVRRIAAAGHEVASHGWDHRRILAMDPQGFREDLRRSKEALEQAGGTAVVGYRAPTFSLVRRTAWALDVLADLGFQYDSSIYPVRHDRYGIPEAPRGPFMAQGDQREILEIPPATVKVAGVNVPVGGGGYFRLLPLAAHEDGPLALAAQSVYGGHHALFPPLGVRPGSASPPPEAGQRLPDLRRHPAQPGPPCAADSRRPVPAGRGPGATAPGPPRWLAAIPREWLSGLARNYTSVHPGEVKVGSECESARLRGLELTRGLIGR